MIIADIKTLIRLTIRRINLKLCIAKWNPLKLIKNIFTNPIVSLTIAKLKSSVGETIQQPYNL